MDHLRVSPQLCVGRRQPQAHQPLPRGQGYRKRVFTIKLYIKVFKALHIPSVCRVGFRRGSWGSVETVYDSKFHFHGKFWINLINLGHFSLFFFSVLLPVNVCKIAVCSVLSVRIRRVSTVI